MLINELLYYHPERSNEVQTCTLGNTPTPHGLGVSLG